MEYSKEEQVFLAHMAQGLVAWETLPAGGRGLIVGKATGMAELFSARGLAVTEAASADVTAGKVTGPFDVIVMVAEPERVQEPAALLASCRQLLAPHGRLLLGMNNRLGLRYFCGDADVYTDRSFDGLDDYFQVYKTAADTFRGRTYSRAEIRRMLAAAGFAHQKWFSVLTDLEHPMMLIAEGSLPRESLERRLFPTYHRPAHAFLMEERLYRPLIEEGAFHAMANAYLIECPVDAAASDVLEVTSSLDRHNEDAFLTIVRGDAAGRPARVEKRAAFPEGEARLQELLSHHEDLRAHGLQTVADTMEDGVYAMPFVDAPTVQVWIERQAEAGNRAGVLAMLDHFHDAIIASSDHVSEGDGDGHGVVLARAYLDLVPINAFAVDDGVMFFDQEFVKENCPADVMVLRMVDFVGGALQQHGIIRYEDLMDRYGLRAQADKLRKIWDTFATELRQVATMMPVRAPHERDLSLIEANRLRCAYPERRYRELFVDIFDGLDDKELVVFGSGAFAKRFVAGYSGRYPLAHIVDNNAAKQGTELGGLTIESPDVLAKLPAQSFKVLICVKGYLAIARQLEAMGITDYACFDPMRDYPSARPAFEVPATPAPEAAEDDAPAKKYHVGYVAGVFDLFHQGHLNLLRRAKAQCDFLVVGVVSDMGVTKYKKVEPFVPEDERLNIVRACRYVDRAEILPTEFAGIRDAWHLFHFDVMFTGSDYQKNAGWLSEKEFLKRNGATIVFFPYTQSTSSTYLKSLIQEKLL